MHIFSIKNVMISVLGALVIILAVSLDPFLKALINKVPSEIRLHIRSALRTFSIILLFSPFFFFVGYITLKMIGVK